MTAYVAAIFKPAKNDGSADGDLDERAAPAQRPAPKLRTRSMRSRSAPTRPSTVLTTIGKNPTSATTTIFGSSPKPSHTIRIGASTIAGTVCDTTRSG